MRLVMEVEVGDNLSDVATQELTEQLRTIIYAFSATHEGTSPSPIFYRKDQGGANANGQ